MCIGIPMRVEQVDGLAAHATTRGGERRVLSLALTGVLDPGVWVLAHLDTAMRTLDPPEAALIADALEGLDASLRGEAFDHLFADLIGRTPQLPAHLRDSTPSDRPVEAP